MSSTTFALITIVCLKLHLATSQHHLNVDNSNLTPNQDQATDLSSPLSNLPNEYMLSSGESNTISRKDDLSSDIVDKSESMVRQISNLASSLPILTAQQVSTVMQTIEILMVRVVETLIVVQTQQQVKVAAAQQGNPPAIQQANGPAIQQANGASVQRANGPAIQQANGAAVQQANGPAPRSEWTCNSANKWSCCPTSEWTCYPASKWSCCPTSEWTCNSTSEWTCNSASEWSCCSTSKWTCNSTSEWTCYSASEWACYSTSGVSDTSQCRNEVMQLVEAVCNDPLGALGQIRNLAEAQQQSMRDSKASPPAQVPMQSATNVTKNPQNQIQQQAGMTSTATNLRRTTASTAGQGNVIRNNFVVRTLVQMISAIQKVFVVQQPNTATTQQNTANQQGQKATPVVNQKGQAGNNATPQVHLTGNIGQDLLENLIEEGVNLAVNLASNLKSNQNSPQHEATTAQQQSATTAQQKAMPAEQNGPTAQKAK